MPNGNNWQGDVLRDLRAGGTGETSAPGQEQAPRAGAGAGAGAGTAPTATASTGTPRPGTPRSGTPRPGTARTDAAPALDAPTASATYAQSPLSHAQNQATRYVPQPHPPTPESRPAVEKALAAAGRKPRRGEPVLGRALRAVRRTVASSAAAEVTQAARTAEALQQPVITGRQIVVTSIRGGAGKTTLAALLGTTYAHYRQDPVLVLEADPALGTLPLRLGVESLRWTAGDLARIVQPQMSLLDVTGYLVQLPDNAWLLPGSRGQVGAMLDTPTYEKVMVSLRRYFGVTVVDCETLPAEVARTALSAAQARVVVVPATVEGVASTHSVLRWMATLPPHVVANTVVVLTESTPHAGVDTGRAAKELEGLGVRVQLLPYDRHLAGGGAIRTELLARSTRQAAARIAAEVLQLSRSRR
ncbi:MinD/ParA family protein [Streptomyces sp. NPDC058657]|uniref:MinD/ParA family ATP-binding protein n=1 Tax=unclassified Streptomyces TaxID=2593676 RepID=UPI00365F0435